MDKLELIKSHSDDYRGPAQGQGTEHGDTWPVSVKKINAAIAAINAGGIGDGNAEASESQQPDVLSRLTAIEAAIAEMKPIVDTMRDFFNDDPEAEQPVTTAENTPEEVEPAGPSAAIFGSADGVPALNTPAPDAPYGVRETAGDHLGSAERGPEDGGYVGVLPIVKDQPMPGNYTAADTAVDQPPASDGAFDPTGGTFRIGDGGGSTQADPAPTTLVDNPDMQGSLAGAAAGEGQIVGASQMPDAVITTGEPENRDELIQTADGEYHPITPTADDSGVVLTGAEGQSNPAPQPQGQPVDDPIDPEPIATFDGEPGIPVGGTKDETSTDDNRFVASGASGQVVAEDPAPLIEQKEGQQGDPRPDDEPLLPLAVLADKEQALQAKDELVAANTLPPDVDPEQAVDNPATPPSGETLDRADAGALNNVRTGPK